MVVMAACVVITWLKFILKKFIHSLTKGDGVHDRLDQQADSEQLILHSIIRTIHPPTVLGVTLLQSL